MCEVRSVLGKKDETPSEFYDYGGNIYGNETGTYMRNDMAYERDRR